MRTWTASTTIGAILFLFAAAVGLRMLSTPSSTLPWPTLGGILGSAACFAAAAWLSARRPDRERIRIGQKLWEQGPLGRAWLTMRQRLLRS